VAKTGLANNTKKKIYVLFKLGVCLFQRKKGREKRDRRIKWIKLFWRRWEG
jgi:hypothetical protein